MAGIFVEDLKRGLRRSFLARRESMSAKGWRESSDLLCTHLQHCPQFMSARTVLIYQSCRQEPDLSYLVNRDDKVWGLSRCLGTALVWHRWQPSERLVTGAYGILEPEPNLPVLEPDQIDLMLVPAVAIDRQGYRLGYGGGYYDRLRADPVWGKIPTIGIVFEFAYVDALPIDPWDLKLEAIVTETGYYHARTN